MKKQIKSLKQDSKLFAKMIPILEQIASINNKVNIVDLIDIIKDLKEQSDKQSNELWLQSL